MKCLIVANGRIESLSFIEKIIKEHDYIICADGGAKHLFKLKIMPNVIIGDLDSIDEESKHYFYENKVEFYKFPSKKDYTDTELAIRYATKKNAKEITIIGAIGTRMDHTLANITLLLPLVKKNIKAKMIDENNEIMVIDKKTKINGNVGEYVSIIPLSEEVTGITLKGFEYVLENQTICMGSSMGVSNRFSDSCASITVDKGNLLVIKARD
ncbi:thiamine diphosphokinase [Lutibacter sp. B2]|nr:thiamine diphosphokinase [Lutibacter sp. B2]